MPCSQRLPQECDPSRLEAMQRRMRLNHIKRSAVLCRWPSAQVGGNVNTGEQLQEGRLSYYAALFWRIATAAIALLSACLQTTLFSRDFRRRKQQQHRAAKSTGIEATISTLVTDLVSYTALDVVPSGVVAPQEPDQLGVLRSHRVCCCRQQRQKKPFAFPGGERHAHAAKAPTKVFPKVAGNRKERRSDEARQHQSSSVVVSPGQVAYFDHF